MQISSHWSHVLNGKKEGMMTLVADGFSFEEMKALQGVCADVRLGQRVAYKEFLSDLDDQVWIDLSDDWQKVSVGKGRRKSHPVTCGGIG